MSTELWPVHRPDSAPLHDLGYGYDSLGRLATQTGSLASQLLPSESAGSTFDDNNRQTAYDGRSLIYDGNGNVIDDGISTYLWNSRDQLVEIKQGIATVASFEYDAIGRRYEKTEGGTVVEYLHDGQNPVQETRGSTVEPVLTGIGMDERNAKGPAASRQYFLNDGLGSTRLLTDANGLVINRYDYDPYGGTQQTNSVAQNAYRYTGREQDESGLYYYRARYFHPGMARFISEDPLKFGAGDNNFYAYVGGDPMSYTDPTGEIAFIPILIGIGVGIAFDYALDWYKKQNCGCQNSATPLGPYGNGALGGAIGGSGPFAAKPRGGVAGGGPAGTRTSSFSQINHAAEKKGWYSVAKRNGITKGLRKIPYAGSALALYEVYDASSCN